MKVIFIINVIALTSCYESMKFFFSVLIVKATKVSLRTDVN
jgi:hypothetical protein